MNIMDIESQDIHVDFWLKIGYYENFLLFYYNIQNLQMSIVQKVMLFQKWCLTIVIWLLQKWLLKVDHVLVSGFSFLILCLEITTKTTKKMSENPKRTVQMRGEHDKKYLICAFTYTVKPTTIKHEAAKHKNIDNTPLYTIITKS